MIHTEEFLWFIQLQFFVPRLIYQSVIIRQACLLKYFLGINFVTSDKFDNLLQDCSPPAFSVGNKSKNHIHIALRMRFWYAMCHNFIESFTVLHLVSRSHKFRKNVMVSRGFSGFMLSAIMFAGKPQITNYSFFKIGFCRQYNIY